MAYNVLKGNVQFINSNSGSIESMVDEHNWLINRVPDDDERFSAIYIQADDMAKELKMDREEFWTIFFN